MLDGRVSVYDPVLIDMADEAETPTVTARRGGDVTRHLIVSCSRWADAIADSEATHADGLLLATPSTASMLRHFRQGTTCPRAQVGLKDIVLITATRRETDITAGCIEGVLVADA